MNQITVPMNLHSHLLGTKNFFKMIVSVRLGFTDISKLISELGISNSEPINKTCVFSEFLKSKEGIAVTSYKEYKQQITLLQHLLPKDLRLLSYTHIDSIKQVLSKLPKRNIQKYREMTPQEVIKEDVATNDMIAIKSQNEYLKTLRSFLKFAEII